MDINILIKAHSGIALLSLLIYLVRGGFMIAGSVLVSNIIAVAAASLSMVLVLGTALGVVFMTGLGLDGFVITKGVGLLLYVVLGVVSLKPGLSKPVAIVLWLLGLAAFIATYLVALGKIAPVF